MGELLSDGGQHLAANPGHFDLKFPVGSIFGGIGVRVRRIKLGIVQSSADLTGKEKGPADADGADGVQLIRIKEDSGLQAFRPGGAARPISCSKAAGASISNRASIVRPIAMAI